MVEISPNHQGAKQKGNNACTSYKEKSAKDTKPEKEDFWICGKLGHHKKDCSIYKRKIKSYEEKKGNMSSSNGLTMKGNYSQDALNYGLDSNQNDSISNVVQDGISW